MKRIIKIIIFYISDILDLLLLFIRFFAHGRVKYPLASTNCREVSVLGNGPSLKSFIGNNKYNIGDAICVNFSPLTDEFYRIKPQYLILIDPGLFHIEDSHVKDLSLAIKEKVVWPLTIVINRPNLDIAKKLYGCYNVRFILLPQITFEPRTNTFIKLKYRLFRKGLTMPSAQNVAIAAIFIAINGGYKNISLYGLEHSWLEDTYISKDNVPCLRDRHYYGVKDVPWDFNPDGTPWKLYQLLDALSLVFKGYCDLQTYADYLGEIRIINKTKGSWIDAFEREA